MGNCQINQPTNNSSPPQNLFLPQKNPTTPPQKRNSSPFLVVLFSMVLSKNHSFDACLHRWPGWTVRSYASPVPFYSNGWSSGEHTPQRWVQLGRLKWWYFFGVVWWGGVGRSRKTQIKKQKSWESVKFRGFFFDFFLFFFPHRCILWSAGIDGAAFVWQDFDGKVA